MTVDEIAKQNAELIRQWESSKGPSDHILLPMDNCFILLRVSPLYMTTKYRAFALFSDYVDNVTKSFVKDFETIDEARAAIPEMKMDLWRCFFF